MALVWTLIFILVLCCQPASAISTGQHESSRENYISHSRIHPEIWPLTAVEKTKIDKSEIKQESTLQHYNSFDDICQTCLGIEDCRSKMRKFCSSPSANCPLFVKNFERHCLHYRCTRDFDCQVRWKNSMCSVNKCYCQWNFLYNFDDNKCNSIIYKHEQRTSKTTRTHVGHKSGFGGRCNSNYECSWKNLLCVWSQCVCPYNTRPNFVFKHCEKNYIHDTSNKHGNYFIGVAISFLLILLFVAVCISWCRGRRSDRSPKPDNDHQSQNHGYHVDCSQSDGHTNHNYRTFDHVLIK